MANEEEKCTPEEGKNNEKKVDSSIGVKSAEVDSSRRLWIKFYEQASKFAKDETVSPSSDDEKLNKRIIVTLNTITRVLFGLDSERKSWAVSYGEGTLELIVALVKKSRCSANVKTNNKKLDLCVIKALKTCALRNPPGRARCRSSGVLDVMKIFLEFYINTGDSEMSNEALTTLAAICLGDELNSLQGAIEFQIYIDKASSVFSSVDNPTIHQKIMYLNALFETMRKDQSKLIEKIKGQERLFFSRVIDVEVEMRKSYGKLMKQQFSEAQSSYDNCMKLLLETNYLPFTSLLDPIKFEIYKRRAHLRLQEGNMSGCIGDLDILLEQKLSVDQRFDNLKMKAMACLRLNNDDKAREALGKALLLKPGDESVKSILDGIEEKS